MTSALPPNLAVTRDALLDGRLTLVQPARGYRVNIDALLLADFAAASRPVRVLDLGAGVGTVGLLLHHWVQPDELSLLERDADLSRLAEHNLATAGARGAVYCVDLDRSGLPEPLVGWADLVVSNPPFFEAPSATPSLDPQVEAARRGALEPFLMAAARALRRGRSRAAFAYPARSLELLFKLAQRSGLVAKRLRFVHSRAERPARLALVELRRAKLGGLSVLPPLIEWRDDCTRSAELTRLLQEPAGDRTGSPRPP